MARRRFTYDPYRRLASAVVLRALQELAATYAEEANAAHGKGYVGHKRPRPLWKIQSDRCAILQDLGDQVCQACLGLAGMNEDLLTRALEKAKAGDPHMFAVNQE